MELLIENLSKRYGDKWVLREVNLRSGPGMLGLLGANGAGKTTLLRIIATRLRQTTGSVSWAGFNTRTHSTTIRASLGYLPQDFGVYPEFTARQFLRYIATLKGLSKKQGWRQTEAVLEMVELQNEANDRLDSYSSGMKQRVGIAQALLNDPALLVVDEPTAGLDPEQRVRFRTLLANLTLNRLVILSTHIVSDVEAIAGKLALIRQGQILVYTTPAKLIEQARGQVWEIQTDAVTAQQLQASYRASRVVSGPGGLALRLLGPGRPHPLAQPVQPTLEDACLLAMQGLKGLELKG